MREGGFYSNFTLKFRLLLILAKFEQRFSPPYSTCVRMREGGFYSQFTLKFSNYLVRENSRKLLAPVFNRQVFLVVTLEFYFYKI